MMTQTETASYPRHESSCFKQAVSYFRKNVQCDTQEVLWFNLQEDKGKSSTTVVAPTKKTVPPTESKTVLGTMCI